MNPNGRRRLIIDVDAVGPIRQTVGPVAWFVAEELMLAAAGDDETPVVSTSVRALAARLGLGRDAVGSALARLRDTGLVTVEPGRAPGGRFDGICYRLQVPGIAVDGDGGGWPDAVGPCPGGPDAVGPSSDSTAREPAPNVPTSRSPRVRSQLSLLDPDPSTPSSPPNTHAR